MPDPPALSQYGYNPKSRRYVNLKTGRFVPAKDVRAAVDAVIDAESMKSHNIGQQLIDGKVTLADWQGQMTSNLKTLHVAMGVAGNGGFQNTSSADFGFIGSLIKKQYAYLRDFAKQVASGAQALNGSLLARAALYVQAGRETYESVVARLANLAGSQQEKSILGLADHCTGANSCVEQAARGWAPIGTLVPIGQRKCGPNCHCMMQYR
jgi:hypothetical protein